MNTLVKRLPLFAFVLAAFAAFAFTSPKEEATDMYGNDGTHWYLIEGEIDETYRCDSDTQLNCLYDAVDGNPISPEVKQKFVNLTLDPIAPVR